MEQRNEELSKKLFRSVKKIYTINMRKMGTGKSLQEVVNAARLCEQEENLRRSDSRLEPMVNKTEIEEEHRIVKVALDHKNKGSGKNPNVRPKIEYNDMKKQKDNEEKTNVEIKPQVDVADKIDTLEKRLVDRL